MGLSPFPGELSALDGQSGQTHGRGRERKVLLATLFEGEKEMFGSLNKRNQFRIDTLRASPLADPVPAVGRLGPTTLSHGLSALGAQNGRNRY